ncbi:hypothetical protein M3J09_013866 [Ascochyta lentis]
MLPGSCTIASSPYQLSVLAVRTYSDLKSAAYRFLDTVEVPWLHLKVLNLLPECAAPFTLQHQGIVVADHWTS